MALPLIFLPPGIPLPLLSGFGVTLGQPFDHTPALQGEGRKRRVFTRAPRTVPVSWLLTDEQMQIFDSWAENDLRALSRRFTIGLKRIGVGFEYWAAEWIEPYTSEPIASPEQLWRVTGSLLLTGEPSDALPSTGELSMATAIVLGGSGILRVPNALSLTTEISLGTIASLLLVTEIICSAPDVGGFELREDGGRELREDGSYELRE